MNCLLANGFACVQHAPAHVLPVVCWTDQEVTDPLRIFVHVAVLLRSALAEGPSPRVGSPEYGCDRASCGSLRPLGAHPAKAGSFRLLSRALQLHSALLQRFSAATAVCLMVSGHFSTQTCL